jgi:hypothetical protein
VKLAPVQLGNGKVESSRAVKTLKCKKRPCPSLWKIKKPLMANSKNRRPGALYYRFYRYVTLIELVHCSFNIAMVYITELKT